MAVVLVAGLLPWVVVISGPSVTVVAAFGLVDPSSRHVTTIWTYLFVLTRGLPEALLAWPAASLLYVGSLVSASTGWLTTREDRRLTGGLLVLAGWSLLPVTLSVGRPAGVVAIPIGTVALWFVAWWGYHVALVRAVRGSMAGRGR